MDRGKGKTDIQFHTKLTSSLFKEIFKHEKLEVEPDKNSWVIWDHGGGELRGRRKNMKEQDIWVWGAMDLNKMVIVLKYIPIKLFKNTVMLKSSSGKLEPHSYPHILSLPTFFIYSFSFCFGLFFLYLFLNKHIVSSTFSYTKEWDTAETPSSCIFHLTVARGLLTIITQRPSGFTLCKKSYHPITISQ